MKKIIIALLAFMPLACMAQNTWEAPTVDSTQIKAELAKKAQAAAEKKHEDDKYLAGAVPEVNGKVVFTLDRDVPGKTADQIYSAVYAALQALTQEQCEFPSSKISVVNKGEHTIAARYKEWLVFQSTFTTRSSPRLLTATSTARWSASPISMRWIAATPRACRSRLMSGSRISMR